MVATAVTAPPGRHSRRHQFEASVLPGFDFPAKTTQDTEETCVLDTYIFINVLVNRMNMTKSLR